MCVASNHLDLVYIWMIGTYDVCALLMSFGPMKCHGRRGRAGAVLYVEVWHNVITCDAQYLRLLNCTHCMIAALYCYCTVLVRYNACVRRFVVLRERYVGHEPRHSAHVAGIISLKYLLPFITTI